MGDGDLSRCFIPSTYPHDYRRFRPFWITEFELVCLFHILLTDIVAQPKDNLTTDSPKYHHCPLSCLKNFLHNYSILIDTLLDPLPHLANVCF